MNLAIGTLTLDPFRQLLNGQAPVAMGGRALEVLSILAEARGGLVTKDDLIRAAWNGTIVEDNAIQAQISLVRKALGSEAGRLVAVHGRGYKLDVEPAEASVPVASVAVLPFANLTGDADKEYLSDSMAEELIITLSRASELKVPSRTSSFAYRHLDKDLREIAEDLQVAHVLEGSVRSAGERLRISAQLIEAKTGFHVWSKSYDRQFGDLLELQDELAAAIASALRAEFGIVELRKPDFEAYQLMSRAFSLAMTNPGNAASAITLLDQAIDRDPNFARAYSLRSGFREMGTDHGVVPSNVELVERDLRKAIALDPDDPFPHIAMASNHARRREWHAADREYRFAQNYSNPEPAAHSGYAAYVLDVMGHLARGREHMLRCVKIAPASALARVNLAMSHSFAGDHEAAAHQIEIAAELGFPREQAPASPILAQGAAEKGDYLTAAEWFGKGMPPPLLAAGGREAFRLAYASLAGQGSRTEAALALERFVAAIFETDNLTNHVFGAAFMLDPLVRLGLFDLAYTVTGKMADTWDAIGHMSNVWVPVMWVPHFASFRADPRFSELARRVGMFEFWAENGPPDGYHFDGERLVPKNEP